MLLATPGEKLGRETGLGQRWPNFLPILRLVVVFIKKRVFVLYLSSEIFMIISKICWRMCPNLSTLFFISTAGLRFGKNLSTTPSLTSLFYAIFLLHFTGVKDAESYWKLQTVLIDISCFLFLRLLDFHHSKVSGNFGDFFMTGQDRRLCTSKYGGSWTVIDFLVSCILYIGFLGHLKINGALSFTVVLHYWIRPLDYFLIFKNGFFWKMNSWIFNFCSKKSLRPPEFFRKKSLRSLFFFQKKSAPPFRWSRPGYPMNLEPSLSLIVGFCTIYKKVIYKKVLLTIDWPKASWNLRNF